MDSDQSGSKNTGSVKLKIKSEQKSDGNELQYSSRKKQTKGIELVSKNMKESPKDKENTIQFVQLEKDIEDELNNIIQLRFDIVKSKISSKTINEMLAYFSKQWKKVKLVTQHSSSQNPQKVKYLLNQYQINQKYTRTQPVNGGKTQMKRQTYNLPIYEEQNSRQRLALQSKIAQLKLQNQKLSEDARKTRQMRIQLEKDFRKIKTDVVANVKNLQIKQTTLEEQIFVLINQKQKLSDEIQRKERKMNTIPLSEPQKQNYKVIIQKLQRELELERNARKHAQTIYNQLNAKSEDLSDQYNSKIINSGLKSLQKNEVVISNQELLKLQIWKNAYEKLQSQNQLLANTKEQLRQRLLEYQIMEKDLKKQIEQIKNNNKQNSIESTNNRIQELIQQMNALKQKKEQQFNCQQLNIMQLQDKNNLFKYKLQNSINQMNKKSETYQQQIQTTNHSIKELNQRILYDQQVITEKDCKYKELQCELQNIKLQYVKKISENGELSNRQVQINAQREVIINLTNELNYQKQQAEIHKKIAQDQKYKLQRLLIDLEVLNGQKEQIVKQKEQLKLECRNIKIRMYSIQEQKQKIKSQKQKQAAEICSERRQLKQQKQNNQKKIDEFQQKCAQLTYQIQELKKGRLNDLVKDKYMQMSKFSQQLKQEQQKSKLKENNYNIEKERLNQQIKFLQDQMILKQNKLFQEIQNYSLLKKQYNELNMKYIQCEQKLSSLVKTLAQKDNAIGLLQQRLQLASKKEANFMAQMSQNEKQKQKKDSLYSYERGVFQSKLNQKGLQISELTNQIQILNETIQQSNILNSQLSEEIQKSKQYMNNQIINKEEITHLTIVGQQKDQEIQKLQEKNRQNQLILDQMGLKFNMINQIDVKVRQMQKELESKIAQVLALQERIKKLTSQNQQNLLQKIKQIEEKKIIIEQLSAKLTYFQEIPKQSDRMVNSLFQNEVLAGHIDHKKYLKDVIEQRSKLQIIRTKLIYSFDPLNLTNFHKYIDQKSGIVVIIKMINGNFLAGYCQGQFNKKKASNQDGLIISLTNRETFVLVDKGRRPITYDDYYLIFGNSEIRLRSQEKIIFSNFGISNGYYASRGKNVSILLGGSPQQRELQMEHFEVYQLIMVE